MGARSYDDLREESKERRAGHRQHSLQLLLDRGFTVEKHNKQGDGSFAHLVVSWPEGDTVVDFWPGTGKWIVRGEPRDGRGVFPLMNLLVRAARA